MAGGLVLVLVGIVGLVLASNSPRRRAETVGQLARSIGYLVLRSGSSRPFWREKISRREVRRGVPVGNLIRLANEAESRDVSVL